MMKKLLFLIPFCVAAAYADDPQMETIVYKPIEGTNNNFNTPAENPSTEKRTGTWTNPSTPETAAVSYSPTATHKDGSLYPVSDEAIKFDTAMC